MMFLVHLLVLQWRSYGTNEEGNHFIIKINKKLVFLGRQPFLFLRLKMTLSVDLGLIEPY